MIFSLVSKSFLSVMVTTAVWRVPPVRQVVTSLAPPGIHAAQSISVGRILDDYLKRYACGSDNTSKARRHDVEYFRDFARENAVDDASEITPAVIKSFVESRRKAGEAPSTVRRRFDVVKHCIRRAAFQHRFEDPFLDLRSPFVPRPQPGRLHESEIDRVRAALKGNARNAAIFEVFVGTGFRRTQLCSLTLGNLNTAEWSLENCYGKGHELRTVDLGDIAIAALNEYLPERAALLGAAADDARYPLFCSTYGNREGDPLSYRFEPKTVYTAMKKAGADAGVKIWTHLLRHTCVHEYYKRSGYNIVSTRDFIGHSTVNVTAGYAGATRSERKAVIESMYKKDDDNV